MNKSLRRLALPVLVLLLASVQGEAGWETPISGDRVQISEPPLWSFSGIWDASGEQLLVLDVLKGEVVQIDARGHRVATYDGFDVPALIHRAGPDSIWIEGEDGHLVLLDNKFQRLRMIDLTKEAISPSGSLFSVLNWVPISEKSILIAGDLKRDRGATGVVVRLPLENPSRYNVLREIGIETATHRSYLIGLPYLTAVNGEPYFLELGESPRIVKPGGGSFQIIRNTSAGKQVLSPPVYPSRLDMKTTALLFERLERTSYPAGIYGWKGFLYVVMRTPAEKGSTLWSLLKIHPETNEVLWNRRLETSANHLIVVPGEKYWAFVEKGPVKGPGNQKVKSFLRVSSKLIESPL